MDIKKIVKQLDGQENLKTVRKYVTSLKFEERFNALREMIYHVDLYLAEGNLDNADIMLQAAEKLSLYVDEGYEGRIPDKVRSLKNITKKKRAKYYENKGNSGEAITQYNLIMESLKLPEEESFQAEMLMEIGILQEQMGQKQEALEKFTQASQICGKKGDTFNYQASLFNCAHVLYDMSYYYKAEEFCRAVIKHSKKEGKVLSPVAHSYLELANISELFNKDDEAKVFYKKALESYRHLNEKVKMSDILNRIGAYEMHSKSYAGALAIFKDALDIKRSVDYMQAKARFYETMGDQLRLNEAPEEALNYYNLAFYFFGESGNDGRKIVIKQKIFKILSSLGLISKDLGTYIEEFKKKLPDFSEVIELEKLDYDERMGEGSQLETIREWAVPHRFRVNRKFLFYLVRNLSRVFETLEMEEDRKTFTRMRDVVEKKFRRKRGSS